MKKLGLNNTLLIVFVSLFLCTVITLICCVEFYVPRVSRGIVPTDEQVQSMRDSGGVYDHVVIFGVDGAGSYYANMNTPVFDKIFGDELDASVSYSALAQFPTISAQNWGSMIHGVVCGKHMRDNTNTSYSKYTDTKYPSFFKVYAEKHPDVSMVSVVDWANINIGIIEDMPQMKKINITDIIEGGKNAKEEDIDAMVAEETIKEIKNNNHKIVFTHFDCVDFAGHKHGWGSPEYETAISYVDTLIDSIYEACKEVGWGNNTLFVLVTDHGHKPTGGHGDNTTEEKLTTVAVAGGKGNIIKGTPGYIVNQDVASIVLYALGEKQPKSWDGGVPKQMFLGL